MIGPDDLSAPYKPTIAPTPVTPIDVDKDVMPIYSGEREPTPPSKLKLLYDALMLVAIVADLSVIFFDQIVMSAFFSHIASWLSWTDWLMWYQSDLHLKLSAIGGFFTLFLIFELLVRWAIAIKKRTYYRWFFFPFAHWYEVLGCFPLLRPLRLLRAFVIIKRLHEIGIQVVPARWTKTARFYGHILLEELSDRVILTAVDNFRTQLRSPYTHTSIESTINKNRADIEQAILLLLRQELTPKLGQLVVSDVGRALSSDVGAAVEEALAKTPELRRYLKLIPIAGSMIEAQMVDIGKHIGENVTTAVNEALLSPALLDRLMGEIAHGIANIDTSHPQLQRLIANIIEDGLTAFEAQIKIQQWKHVKQLHL